MWDLRGSAMPSVRDQAGAAGGTGAEPASGPGHSLAGVAAERLESIDHSVGTKLGSLKTSENQRRRVVGAWRTLITDGWYL